jgi:hypothetical protein
LSTKIIVVVGMHRSGTSMCANMLQMLGADMAESSLAAPGNTKGHWERPRLMDMNDAVFSFFGRSWSSPAHILDLPPAWLDDPRVQAVRAEAAAWLGPRVHAGRPFGFKDPRTTLLLPLWRQVLGDIGAEPVYVFCVRDPAQVARSLQLRDGMDRGQAEYRWLAYTAEAINEVAGDPVCTVPYEAWFENPGELALRLAHHVGLPEPSDNAVRQVIDGELRHDDSGIQPALKLASHLHRLAVHDAERRHFGHALRNLASMIRDVRAQVQPLLVDLEVARTGLADQRRVIDDLQSLVRRLREDTHAS